MQIFKVGGAVRDFVLGREPKDIDYVVVGATTEQMLNLGYSQVGAAFPVFLHPQTGDEYALARVEKKIGAGYHGFETQTENVTLEEDCLRRDLTINALAQCVDSGEIIDHVGGISDLQNKILRHVSNAFAEDPLRVVRLMRFANRFGDFSIAEDTLQLAKMMVKNGELNQISHERFWAEITKVFSENRFTSIFFKLLFELEMHIYVDFFRELLSPKLSPADISATALCCSFSRWVEMAGEDLSEDEAEDFKTYCFSAVSIPTGAVVKSTPTRIAKAARGVQAYLAISEFTPENILSFAKSVQAFSQGTLYADVMRAITILHQAGKETHDKRAKLDMVDFVKLAIIRMSTISSDGFQHLSGKQIGEAMDRARIDCIKCGDKS